MKLRNFTPHTIMLNSGEIFASEGLARVSATFTTPIEGVCEQVFGEVTGLPEPQVGVLLIVSAMVLSASNRSDLVAPATGHPDCIRENGFIKSVPCFVR
jgi:hypothetical protein